MSILDFFFQSLPHFLGGLCLIIMGLFAVQIVFDFIVALIHGWEPENCDCDRDCNCNCKSNGIDEA